MPETYIQTQEISFEDFKNNILGIENNFAGVYKKFDNTEKGCGYIRSNDVDKSVIFRISKMHHEK